MFIHESVMLRLFIVQSFEFTLWGFPLFICRSQFLRGLPGNDPDLPGQRGRIAESRLRGHNRQDERGVLEQIKSPFCSVFQ